MPRTTKNKANTIKNISIVQILNKINKKSNNNLFVAIAFCYIIIILYLQKIYFRWKTLIYLKLTNSL
jgi:hypothetical protein